VAQARRNQPGSSGILFLDELPEFGSRMLEMIRQPIEDKIVAISRNRGAVSLAQSDQGGYEFEDRSGLLHPKQGLSITVPFAFLHPPLVRQKWRGLVKENSKDSCVIFFQHARFTFYVLRFTIHFLNCTIITPTPARTIPNTSCQFNRSPRKTQARTAIWINMVLLIMLDSTADSVRSVWFQRVKA